MGSVPAHVGHGYAAEWARLVGAKPEDRVVDVGGDDEPVHAERSSELGGGQVLVYDGFHPAELSVDLAHHRDAATSGRDDYVPRCHQRLDGRRVQHLERLG